MGSILDMESIWIGLYFNFAKYMNGVGSGDGLQPHVHSQNHDKLPPCPNQLST